MKTSLKKIATIQTGYTFRRRIGAMGEGLTAVVQMKDLGDDHLVDCASLVRIDMGKIKAHHQIQPGDIIFRSRGQVTTAAIIAEDPGPAVVASPLIKIHPDSDRVLPAYLAWYINQPVAQAFLSSRAKGTAQKMISKQALAHLEVSLPSLERQQAIIEVATLADAEQRLLKQIAARRRLYISKKLMQTALTD